MVSVYTQFPWTGTSVDLHQASSRALSIQLVPHIQIQLGQLPPLTWGFVTGEDVARPVPASAADLAV